MRLPPTTVTDARFPTGLIAGCKLTAASVLMSVCLCVALSSSASAAFPGASGRIAFQREAQRNVDIYTISSSGSNIRRLTKAPLEDKWPAWSPDGIKIAITRSVGGRNEVWVMSAQGNRVRRLATNAWDPAWSPDGSRIAYTSARNDGLDIMVVPATGGPATDVTSAAGNDFDPAWSPDGSTILFAGSRGELGEATHIYALHLDGSRLDQLTSGPDSDFRPNWAPDGKQICFVRGNTRNFEMNGDQVLMSDYNIWTMDFDGSEQRQVSFGGNDWDPAWSPDGSQIAFASYRQRKSAEIYLMNSDGGRLRRLTRNNVDDLSPDWQPIRGELTANGRAPGRP